MQTIIVVSLLLASGTSPEARQEILERMTSAPVSSEARDKEDPIPLRPESSLLDVLYNDNAKRLNEIRCSGDMTPAEKMKAIQDFRQSLVSAENMQYLLEMCKVALQTEPSDWDTLRRCFFIAEAGYRDERLISIAVAMISFKEVNTEDISHQQIAATLAALRLLAHLDWPGRFKLMKQCSDGTFWQGVSVDSSARPDLLALLQSSAIMHLAALPNAQAEEILEYLEAFYPPSLFVEGVNGAQFAFWVAVVKADLRRQENGLGPIFDGIR
jgi:hypothetical protein